MRADTAAATAPLLLLLLVAVTGTSGAGAGAREEFQCREQVSEHCACSRSSEYDIDCSAEDVSVIVQYKPREVVKLICTTPGLLDTQDYWQRTLRTLTGLSLGRVRSFIVRMCPGLPPFPFHVLMSSLGVHNVTSFQLKYTSDSNSSHRLTRSHLAGLPSLQQLILSENKLTQLPEDLLADLPALTWLDLKNNRLVLPRTVFRHVPNLEVLELGSNNLTSLEPGIFRNLTRLRLLNLWGNRLHNLTRLVFTDVPALESLDLNSNHLVSLVPDLLADLTRLKSLNLYNNDFFSLPTGLLSSNSNLEKFKINHNRRTLKLPPGLLSNLTNLKEVIMSHCNLSEVPEDLFHGSTSITNVTFRFNAIQRLPQDLFRDNKELLNVDLSHNRLLTLPDQLFTSQNKIVSLNLASNNITHIKADTLAGLSSLQYLHMEYNCIESIHNMAFQSSTALRKINLSHNKIRDVRVRLVEEEEVQSVLFMATQLEEVDLSYNNLTHLYEDWTTKTRLALINLSHNSFTTLTIEDLIFISDSPKLDLSYNNISIVNFEKAEKLALGIYNKTNSPKNTSVRLRLNGNPIACDCTANSLVKYLRMEMEPEVYYIVEVDPTGLVCRESGEELTTVDPRLLTCPRKEGCPPPCTCLYRPHDTALLVDCSRRGLVSPPRLPDLFHPDLTPSPNQTLVDLSNNNISSIPQNLHTLGYNTTVAIDLSHNILRNISTALLNPHLQALSVEFNNLTKLDNDLINYLDKSKQVKSIVLANNPWTCDCDAKSLLHFVQSNYPKMAKLNNVTCSNGQHMANMTVSDLCPTSNLIIGLSSLIIALLGLIIGSLFALYYRYQSEIKVWLFAHNMCLWFVTEEELDKEKQYDAFISYSHQDEEFIVNKLVPGLENGSTKYRLCLHYRDWVVGDFIPKQIARSVQESKRTVIVLSPAFIESVWGLMEFRTAHQQALSEGRSRVIVVLYGDIGPTDRLDPELRAYLSMNTYVKWGDAWFWEKLRYALPHPVKDSNLPLTTLHDPKPINNTTPASVTLLPNKHTPTTLSDQPSL